MTLVDSQLQVNPVGRTLGAEITGVDLGQVVDDATGQALRDAFHRYKVLFFRDQDIDRDQQVAFAGIFGQVSGDSTYARAEDTRSSSPVVTQIRHDRENARGLDNQWHSDSMFWPEPPMGAMLHALEVPETGGDTVWADMAAAFEGLSSAMQAFLRPLRAVNDVAISASQRGLTPQELAHYQEAFPPMSHPLIRTHPETGQHAIYASAPNTSHIEGLSRPESDALLAFLFAQASIPELQCRWHWRAGDVAMWDNRVTQHYAVYDYWPDTRVMERCFWVGQKPV